MITNVLGWPAGVIAISGYSLYFVCRCKIIFIGSMSKKSLGIVCFMVLCCVRFLCANAQLSHSRWKENFDVNDFRVKTIDIPAPEDKLILQNINGVSVIDARADNDRIGFMQKKIIDPVSGVLNNAVRNQEEQKINTRPTFVKIRNGVQYQSEQFVNGYLSLPCNNSLPSILMVIKKLWLSDELDFNDQRKGDLPGPKSKDVWTSGVDVRIEFYLRAATDYFALYRYDTVISKATTISEYGPQFIGLALQLSLNKMKQMDERIPAIMEKRKFAFEEIIQHNEDAFNMPVLKDIVLKAGVYLTFDEFKNNNPSQREYELKKDKLTDVVYINGPNGKQYMERDVWGYCDGVNAYIKSADNFFVLQRCANAFYVYGAKRIMVVNDAPTAGPFYYPNGGPNGGYWENTPYTSFNGPKRTIKLEPFQLDWSTGKLY